MQHLLLGLLEWAADKSSPMLAGFVGGVIAEAVVLIATRKDSDMPRSVRMQIVLLWLAVGTLLVVTATQGANIQQLLSAAVPAPTPTP